MDSSSTDSDAESNRVSLREKGEARHTPIVVVQGRPKRWIEEKHPSGYSAQDRCSGDMERR
jgi:hypothetical protein